MPEKVPAESPLPYQKSVKMEDLAIPCIGTRIQLGSGLREGRESSGGADRCLRRVADDPGVAWIVAAKRIRNSHWETLPRGEAVVSWIWPVAGSAAGQMYTVPALASRPMDKPHAPPAIAPIRNPQAAPLMLPPNECPPDVPALPISLPSKPPANPTTEIPAMHPTIFPQIVP